jgi:hypothetical protein
MKKIKKINLPGRHRGASSHLFIPLQEDLKNSSNLINIFFDYFIQTLKKKAQTLIV